MFISQPSLSVSVNNLETELGFKIFERSSKGVIPTELGKKALLFAKNIIDRSEQIMDIMEGEKVLIKNLQIAIPAAFSNPLAPDLLMRFHELYPEVNLHIKETPYFEVIDMMENGVYSLGVISSKESQESELKKQLDKRSISYETVTTEKKLRLSLFISSKNALANKKLISLKELSELTMISYKNNYLDPLKSIDISLSKPFVVQDIELVKKLISDNFGYAIFPEIFALNSLYIDNGLIKSIPLKEAEPLNIHILYSTKEPLSHIENELCKVIKELIAINFS